MPSLSLERHLGSLLNQSFPYPPTGVTTAAGSLRAAADHPRPAGNRSGRPAPGQHRGSSAGRDVRGRSAADGPDPAPRPPAGQVQHADVIVTS